MRHIDPVRSPESTHFISWGWDNASVRDEPLCRLAALTQVGVATGEIAALSGATSFR